MSTKKHLTTTEATRLSEVFPQWEPWVKERGIHVHDLIYFTGQSGTEIRNVIDGCGNAVLTVPPTGRWLYELPTANVHLLPDLDDLLEFAEHIASHGIELKEVIDDDGKRHWRCWFADNPQLFGHLADADTRIEAVYAALMAMAETRREGTEGQG
jgi:hypothetical protein